MAIRITGICIVFLLLFSCKKKQPAPQPALTKVLVLTEAQGFKHESISAGMDMFKAKQADWNIEVEQASESSMLSTLGITRFRIIVLLNTTGDLFTDNEQELLQDFVQNGGSILAIHAAADAEYNWPWYGQMLGALFKDHPHTQQATCHKTGISHPSVQNIPASWQRTDEWYNFQSLSPANQVVLTIDETTYTGGTHGAAHPISWYREFDGGKIFYTAMGHTSETYSEPLFLEHIKGAIEWLR